MKQVRGFLLVTAAVLLTLVAFLAATLAYVSINNAQSTANYEGTTQAFYLAEAGLARGLTAIANIVPASRVSCATVDGTGVYNQSVGAGSFSVTGTQYTVSSATLSATITNSDFVIPVSTVTGYAPSGAIRIGGEIINYGGVGTSTSVCGGAISTCFLASSRGAGNTHPTPHSTGRTVSQNMCQLVATGQVPATSPTATRSISRSVMYAETTHIWNAGTANSGELIMRWDGEIWQRQALTSIPDSNLNAMYFNSSTDGWVVGDTFAGACVGPPATTGVFGYWTGSWAQSCGNGMNSNMLAVHCTSTTYCKAGGAALGGSPFLAGYKTPTLSWKLDTLTTTGPQANRVREVNVNDVHVISNSLAFAVGDYWAGTQAGEMIFNWDGSEWGRSTAQASIDDENLYGIDCPSSTLCWVVGDAGTIATWAGVGTTFSGATGPSPFTVNANVSGLALKDVFCMSTTDCWAVGDANGGSATFVRYTGGSNTWARDTTNIDASVASTANLKKIFCDTSTTCWAVGDGYAFYWDGTVWVDWSGGIINASPALVATAVGGATPVPSGPLITNSVRQFQWQEVAN